MTAQRANLFKTSSFVAVCAFALSGVTFVAPTPARAQFGFGGILGHFLCCGGGGHPHRSHTHHMTHHHTDGDDDYSASSTPDDSTRELAKLAPPSAHD